MNILVIIGHPDSGSFSHALAQRFGQKAVSLGHQVKTIDLSCLDFDPILRKDKREQPLEAALVESQDAILWAQKLIFFYPIWWGGMPALLKGWIDRVFLSGFAFKFKGILAWDKLLSGKSAHIFTTMDTPNLVYSFFTGEPNVKQMKNGILEFCGIKPVKFTSFSPISRASDEQRAAYLEDVARFAQKLKH